METWSFTGRHAPLGAFESAVSSDTVIWRQDEWGDMRVGYETYLQDFDDAQLLKGLPNDRCKCPHWGGCAGRRSRNGAHREFSPREAFSELTAIAEKNFPTGSGEVDDDGGVIAPGDQD